MESDTAKEAVGFEQFRSRGDFSRRLPAGNAARKEHLRAAIKGVHVAESRQDIEPRRTRDMRHSITITRDRKLPVILRDGNGFHGSSLERDARKMPSLVW